MRKKILFITLLLSVVSACSVYQTMMNISRLKYKLKNVSNFRINGIDISGKSNLKDFGAMQVIQLTSLVAKGELPVSFTLNIEAQNPNDGSGGYPPTDITIREFPWKLYINDKETISGDITEPIKVPGVGEKVIIPLTAELNLLKFFKSNGFNDAVKLIFALGGKNSNPTHFKVVAQPVLDTPIGKMEYPVPVTIVSQEFN